MSKQNKVPGGNGDKSGGDGADDEEDDLEGDEGGGEGGEPKQVAYDSYKKVLNEKKAARAKATQLENELKTLREANEANEKKKLEEQGSYKELLEKERLKSAELENKLTDITGTLTTAQKRAAILKHIPGKVGDKYQFLIDTNKVIVDEETGEVDDETAKLAASDFLKEHSELVKKANPGLPPGDAAGGGSKKITVSQWKALGDSKKMKEAYATVDWNTD